MKVSVFLLGFMGSGKSTIGRMLAVPLGLPFIDLDHYLEQQQGLSVPALFKALGEKSFRELERDALQTLAQGRPAVIATGGGAPCFFDNMAFMKANGKTLYLKASPEELSLRLKPELGNRPLLDGQTKETLPVYIAQLLEKRSPIYEQADIVVLTDGQTKQDVVRRCLLFLNV
jgi:shikimate kinase